MDGLGYRIYLLRKIHVFPTSKNNARMGESHRKTSYLYAEANKLMKRRRQRDRTRIRIFLNTQDPIYIRVEWKEERDWKERSTNYKTHFFTTIRNCSEAEPILDQMGICAYTIERTYDSKGNLLKKTIFRPTAIYTYDHRNRCIMKFPVSGNFAPTDRPPLMRKEDFARSKKTIKSLTCL